MPHNSHSIWCVHFFLKLECAHHAESSRGSFYQIILIPWQPICQFQWNYFFFFKSCKLLCLSDEKANFCKQINKNVILFYKNALLSVWKYKEKRCENPSVAKIGLSELQSVFPHKTVNLLHSFSDFCGVYTFWMYWFYNALTLQKDFTWATVAMNHSGVFSFLLFVSFSPSFCVCPTCGSCQEKQAEKCELGISVTASLENRNLMMGHLSHSKSFMGSCRCCCACV